MVKINLDADAAEILVEVERELARALSINGPFCSEYEAFGALTEEFNEVVEEFRKSSDKQPEKNTSLHLELVQLAAMCKKWKAMVDGELVSPLWEWEYEGNERARSTMEAMGNLVYQYEFLIDYFKRQKGGAVYKQLFEIWNLCVAAVLSLCTIGGKKDAEKNLDSGGAV